MGQKLSSFSIITAFLCFALIGISMVPLLSVQLKPSEASSSIAVNYSWQDASAKVIEQEVTSKLEGLFNGVKGVEDIKSTSKKGGGSINIQFKKDTDMDAVRFELANLIRQGYPKLPQGVSYPQLSMSIASENKSPILTYSVNANESPYYIKKYADNHIVPKLTNINGVSQVSVYGASPYEWVITYDANKLFQLNISVNDISSAVNTFLSKSEIGKARVIVPEKEELHEIAISLIAHSYDSFDWEKIPIKKMGNRIIHLEDIATVRFKEGKVRAFYRINGLNTLSLVVYPEKGINTIKLTETVKTKIAGLEKELNPGYSIKLTQDTTAHLVKELQKIKLRTFFSLIILLVLTIVVYRNIRYLTILFLSIVMNLLVAVIFYYLLKVELQLYSFAGITISFGIIIDNTIIMMDHLRNKGNKKAFLAILAATLTTIGAVLVIFLLEESQRANLWDFALVIAINLGVSLFVALYLVPALLDKLKLQGQQKRFSRKRKRRTLRLTRLYQKGLVFLKKPVYKWPLIVMVIFGFGLPLHLAPKEIKKEGFWPELYNVSIGSDWFGNDIRPTLEKVIGGTFRLFTENVFDSSYYSEPERTTLMIRGSMPEGGTIDQLNGVIQKMENYIASFDEVELFETHVYSYRNSNISVYFKEEYGRNGFPYILKSLLESKAVSLGGLDWSIVGVGRGFSNALGTDYRSDQIELEGYNYDKLYKYAEELRRRLIENSKGRVKEVDITSGGWNSNALHEYYLEFNPESIAMANLSQYHFYNELKNRSHSRYLRPIVNNNELQEVRLVSNKYREFNIWDLKNTPLSIGNGQYKLDQLATISKKKTGNTIEKHNQQYHLAVTFDFIGPRPLANKFKEEQIKQMANTLPVGYKVSKPIFSSIWDKDNKNQYYYIFVIIAIIFFICAVLLESMIQPMAIISMIPISFIGVFLTFYLFEFNFDQGGYASFILLSGISVNAALYIINDFNNLKKKYPKIQKLRLYLKAYNHKIIPILITIISTIGGLVPFVWSGQEEVFWFSFAAGSIGGLLFSLLGIWLYLPLLIFRK